MNGWQRTAYALSVAVCLGLGTSACSGQPAVCDDVESLQASLDRLSQARISEGAAQVISTELTNLRQDLAQLADDAAQEYSEELRSIRSAATALEDSVETAAGNPSADTLSEVTATLQALRTAVSEMAEAVSDTC